MPSRTNKSAHERITTVHWKIIPLVLTESFLIVSSAKCDFKYMKKIAVSAPILLFSRVKTYSGPHLLYLKLFINYKIPKLYIIF